MSKNVVKLITKAIKERKLIALRYRGQADIRVIEPHAMYRDERDEVVVDGFQVRGFSASGRPPPFWRPYRVKKITALNVLGDRFIPRLSEGFTLNKQRYKKELLAAVDVGGMHYMYPPEALQDMGPPKPEFTRRYF